MNNSIFLKDAIDKLYIYKTNKQIENYIKIQNIYINPKYDIKF